MTIDLRNEVHRRFAVQFVLELQNGEQPLRVLDYGCGKGDMVRLLRRAGLCAYGTELFYGGDTWDDPGLRELLDQEVVRALDEDGRIPFEPESFDLVLSDQVLEHVAELELVAREVDRVLKPGGRALHQFPTREVVREVHLGVPFVHWMKPGRTRESVTVAARRLGLGEHKGSRGVREWATWKLDWLDKYCHYRTVDEIDAVLARYGRVVHHEAPYVRARAEGRRVVSALAARPSLEPVVAGAFRRFGGSVVEVVKGRAV
jgi:SAM-dependent methyltransferase